MDGFFELLANLRNPIIYCCLLVSPPSFLLYCTECWVICRHPKLHNSFNWLYIVGAIPNMFNFLTSFYGRYLPITFGSSILPIYQQIPKWGLAAYWFLLYYSLYADKVAIFFIQFNRFMAVAIPLKCEKFWRKFLPFSVLIIYSIPLYLSYPCMTMDVNIAITPNDPYSNNATSFALRENGTTHIVDAANLNALFSTGFLIVCTCLNVLTLILYKCKNRLPNQQNANNKIERNLLIYTICTFFGQALLALVFVMLFYAVKVHSPMALSAMSSVSPLISDAGTLWLPSWFLIWASTAFRDKWAASLLPECVLKRCRRNYTTKSCVINLQAPVQTNNKIAASNVASRRMDRISRSTTRTC